MIFFEPKVFFLSFLVAFAFTAGVAVALFSKEIQKVWFLLRNSKNSTLGRRVEKLEKEQEELKNKVSEQQENINQLFLSRGMKK